MQNLNFLVVVEGECWSCVEPRKGTLRGSKDELFANAQGSQSHTSY